MDFDQLLHIIGNEPVFETGLLLAGSVDPNDVRRQLSRWTKNGKLYQQRRGVYTLAPPYQKVKPHPFLIANKLVRNSYVSLQSALAYYGMIPEYVPVTTSITTTRPARWETDLGIYTFRRIKKEWFTGYQNVALGNGQSAFIATPEKALLDLIYLQPGSDSTDYLNELRLQSLEQLDIIELGKLAKKSAKPKLQRAARFITDLAAKAGEYEVL